MKENCYYNDIKSVIEELEINNKLRVRKDNNDRVKAYWQVGKMLVEAQGGKEKAKYGSELIKRWSVNLKETYGNGYNETNLKYFRQFYLDFPNGHALRSQLTWTHYRSLLVVKSETERDFYINLALENNLSSRELDKEIKNKAFAKQNKKYYGKSKEVDTLVYDITKTLGLDVAITNDEEDSNHNEEYYYNEISSIIENLELDIKVREIKSDNAKVRAFWNIGELIVKAQGGKEKSEYGSKIIKKWSLEFEKSYGKNYNERNLKYYRKFYLVFPNGPVLSGQLIWTHYRSLLSIKNENERNYYINLVIEGRLTTRELDNEIKNKAFERLSYADKQNIKIIDKNYTLTIGDMIKDPILIRSEKNLDKLNEKLLHKFIIEMIEERFLELGLKFTLAGHEYKIRVDKHTYKLDLLFFNVKLNAYVVLELKVASMKVKDVDQVKFYTSLVDKYVKEDFNNPTIGLLITKDHDDFTIKYASEKDIFTTRYKLIDKKEE